jgi:NAD(P)H-flavin reductase
MAASTMVTSPAGTEVTRGPMTPARYRVVARRSELSDTQTLVIEAVDEALPAPTPGQFSMLWAFGVGEVPISVSRLGVAGGRVEHTVRAVGATTRALCALNQGDVLGVRGPFGRGWDLTVAEGGDVVVVAGGLGLAPVRPVIEEILAHRDRFGQVAVLIGARSPDDLLFVDDVSTWRAGSEVDVEVTVDHARSDWTGDVGVVTGLIPRAGIDPLSASAFVCGPEIMMRFAVTGLVDLGLAPERIQLSLERNMVCAVGHCGHCQLGPTFVCQEGPVYTVAALGPLLDIRSL